MKLICIRSWGEANHPQYMRFVLWSSGKSLYVTLHGKLYSEDIFRHGCLIGVNHCPNLTFPQELLRPALPFWGTSRIIFKNRAKSFKKRLTVPSSLDKPLRLLKYFILVLTVVMAWSYGTLWMATYDPYTAYGHISAISDTLKEDPLAIIGFILLTITLIGSLLYDRFFCKNLCPMGALYGIIGKISPTRIERNDSLCIHCKMCSKACPVNIDVEKAVKVTDAECINCNECVAACPKKGALEVKIKISRKTVHPIVMLAVVAGLFFGTIFIAQVTGNFQVLPQALKEGQVIAISELKGYYTIEEAATATGSSLKELYEKLGIPETVSKHTLLKEISKEVPSFNLDEAKSKAGASAVSTSEKPAASGYATEKVDINAVKGSMTIREAAEALRMDVKEFCTLLKIPENVPMQTQMKGISSVSPGYDFEKIKESLK